MLTTADEYPDWKKRMQYFFQTIDFELWNSVTSGPYIAYRGPEVEGQPRVIKTYGEYDEEDKKRVAKDSRALGILTMALSNDILNSFPTLSTAQNLWNSLQTRFEGSDEIKEGKKDLLLTQF